MSNFESQRQELEKYGIGTFDDVPQDILKYLKKGYSKNNKTNKNLAGHIKEEYDYIDIPLKIEKYLINSAIKKPFLVDHSKSIQVLNKNAPFKLHKLWINFQKKYEFNPIHDHSGIWSFIIFLQIPYNLEDEDKMFPETSFTNIKSATSRLNFIFYNYIGKLENFYVNVDKSFVNKMLMFPANLLHSVYPFYTSNKPRITVSGNIVLSI